MQRREFVAALATFAPSLSAVIGQRPEVEAVWAEVPPGATLWGHVYFLSDQPMEVTVTAGKAIEKIRGSFGAKRVAEYSWRNASEKDQPVGIRATSLVGDRELSPAPVEYIKSAHLYVAFGQRGTPEKLTDRMGGYPSEAVFIGYTVFEKGSGPVSQFD